MRCASPRQVAVVVEAIYRVNSRVYGEDAVLWAQIEADPNDGTLGDGTILLIGAAAPDALLHLVSEMAHLHGLDATSRNPLPWWRRWFARWQERRRGV